MFLKLFLAFLLVPAVTEAQKLAPADLPQPHISTPSVDPKLLAGKMAGSYYQPTTLSEMTCGAIVDWNKLFTELHQTLPPERLAMLNGMQAQVQASRNKPAVVTVTWPAGTPSGNESVENGFKQMITGFYQMYWSFAASSLAPKSTDKFEAQVMAGGAYLLKYQAEGTSIDANIDADGVPTKFFLKSPAVTATLEPVFSPNPSPTPGDVRRLTSLHVKEQIGASAFDVLVGMDYQPVGGFYIPHHISFGIVGAYTFPVELIGCSIEGQPPLGMKQPAPSN